MKGIQTKETGETGGRGLRRRQLELLANRDHEPFSLRETAFIAFSLREMVPRSGG
jgi:hypothetical protein